MVKYDMIIIGAGVAGLRVALEAKKINKKLKILILEKYDIAGGRMQTIHTKVGKNNIQYESGAGRINASHKKLLALIKDYDLSTTKISGTTFWRKYGTDETIVNNFDLVWSELCMQLDSLPVEIKRSNTLRDLAIETLGVDLAKSLLETYPYRAEIEVSSAESAIDLYKSLNVNPDFLIINEGFSTLINCMVRDVKKHNIEIKYNVSVNRVDEKEGLYTVTAPKNNGCDTFTASRVVLAVHRNALQYIYPFSQEHPLVKAVRMEPLLRIYSVYNDSSWFPEGKVVTNSPLRYIIPINKSKGLIMSSYLDSRDIELWSDLYKKGKNEELKEKIHNETLALFSDLDIKEKPVFVAPEFWHDGCSYWNTGVDYKKLSKDALQPYPITHENLHIVGESFSTKPQWIEGSLEHADDLITLISRHLNKL